MKCLLRWLGTIIQRNLHPFWLTDRRTALLPSWKPLISKRREELSKKGS